MLSHEDEDAWMEARRHSLKRIRAKREKRRDARGLLCSDAGVGGDGEGEGGGEWTRDEVQELGYESDSALSGSVSGSYGSSTGLGLASGNVNAGREMVEVRIPVQVQAQQVGQQVGVRGEVQGRGQGPMKKTSFRVANPDRGAPPHGRSKTYKPHKSNSSISANANFNANANANTNGGGQRRWDERDDSAFGGSEYGMNGSAASAKMSSESARYRLAHEVIAYSFGSR